VFRTIVSPRSSYHSAAWCGAPSRFVVAIVPKWTSERKARTFSARSVINVEPEDSYRKIKCQEGKVVRALLQRVTEARVDVGGKTVGEIRHGWLVLLGVGHADSSASVEQLADKIAQLRCFEDAQGKTNLSILDVGGQVLLVSQFTLYADLSRGRRPGFTSAAPPDEANRLVDEVGKALRRRGLQVEQGEFGAHMQVSLVNDGPFTIWLDAT
jgi:D-aminoacyl-tRNA deacylase